MLEQSGGPGEFNFVTIVEWASSEAIENARAAVLALHKRINFDSQELFVRLGIKTDLAPIDELMPSISLQPTGPPLLCCEPAAELGR